MLTVHLLGHVHVSQEGRNVHLSAKATALLTYLALQRAPQHREHLADLLWESHDALGNLRVELARLRAQGLDLFPARQPMLALSCDTDLAQFLDGNSEMSERELSDWLAMARGLPLSGLEDLGSPAFQEWVEGQRWALCEQIEEVLSRVYTQQVEAGRERAAELVRARAEQLGVGSLRMLRRGGPLLPRFDRPEARAAFTDVLARAERQPQLLLLGGRSGSGKRSFVQESVSGTDWLLVQLGATSGRRLLLAAIAQSLLKVAPPEARAVLQEVLLRPTDPDDDLVRVASVLVALGQKVVLSIHRAENVAHQLKSMLEFTLDLPTALLIVLATSQTHLWPQLAEGADRGRTHRLELGPVSVPAALRALRPTLQGLDADALRARAARLVQQTDGWPVHLRAFLEKTHNLTAGRAPLPDAARDALLADAELLPERLRGVLARLSMVYCGFDAAFAGDLLGEDVASELAQAQRRGILSPAADAEVVHLPGLRFRPSDLENRLGFASEQLRTALAGSLTSGERAALRARLAELLLPTLPGLSAHYAELAGLAALAETARAQHARLAEPSVVGVGGRALRPEGGAARPSLPRVRLVSEPEAVGGAGRRERFTANGYRLGAEGSSLEVLRLGRFAAPPHLRVLLPRVEAGAWRLVARVDVFRGAPELGDSRRAYPLALGACGRERVVFTPDDPEDFTEDGVRHRVVGGVPLGKWFEFSGHGNAGELEISLRALDLAVTVGRLEWAGQVIEF